MVACMSYIDVELFTKGQLISKCLRFHRFDQNTNEKISALASFFRGQGRNPFVEPKK